MTEGCKLEENAIQVGIIGCGGIAAQHIRGYQTCENVIVAAGADVDLQRAIDVAGEDHAYTSFHEMLDSEKLDAVSICTPPKFHADAVFAALEKGVHVLCEKPLAMNAAEAKAMVDCSARTGKILMTAFCHRFHEPVMHAKELVTAGKVGKVVMFRNRFGGKMDMTQLWFSNPEVSGGGTIPDTSIHSIDLFRYLVGNPIKVAAAMSTADRRYKVEDTSVILLQTRDGAIGTIEASWTTPGSTNVIEVYGTDGAIIIDYSETKLRYLARDSDADEWTEIENTGPDRFVLQAQHFINCIRTGAPPIVDGSDGLRANEVVDAAYSFITAAGSGWVRL